MSILAVDPGPTDSAWCHTAGGSIIGCGKCENAKLLALLDSSPADVLVVERVACYGMVVYQ